MFLMFLRFSVISCLFFVFILLTYALPEASVLDTARAMIVMALVWFHSLRLLAHLVRSYMFAKEESWKHLAVRAWPL